MDGVPPWLALTVGGALAPVLAFFAARAAVRVQKRQVEVDERRLDGEGEQRLFEYLQEIISELREQLALEREWRHGAERRAKNSEGQLELCRADLHRCRHRLTARGISDDG